MEVADGRNAALLDRAYGCFAMGGLAILALFIGSLLIKGDGNQLQFGLTVGVPALLVGFGAWAYGVILTFKFRHHPLVALSLLPILLGIGAGIVSSTESNDPDPLLFNVVPWTQHSACAPGWTNEENVFIKSDGTWLPACMNKEDVRRTGTLRMLPDPNVRIDPALQHPTPRGHPRLRFLAESAAFSIPWIYLSANLLIPAWWFTLGRRRHRTKLIS